MNFPEYPSFETERLILRPPKEADAKSYQRIFADYEIIGHLSKLVPWPYPDDGVITFFRDILFPDLGINRWFWVLALKENPTEAIGGIDLWREGKPEHRGFWLGKPYWGRGLMTEALAPVMQFAFGPAGFEKLLFANAVGNQRSRRIKEKHGARLLRVEPGEFVDPKYTEREIWELTKAEWAKLSPAL